MPIYEYRCRKCGKEFEVFQKITAPDLKECTFCKGPVTKLISLSSFSLKGTGWYVTDYGGKKSQVPSHKEEAEAHKPAAETTAKKDTETK